ncbi:ABC transporter ATP-binding protein/permease [Brucepastera parasyntrophica]|uniref:ABC transporter ATP-binding protein n=1 Tax=Brucepastera parasyntrophica TaxID=2880008 RepID=UPI00210BEFFB|nr:ABC transporter ATP-binding protein [Brucepastera parasyntrophica]ULQ59132.1 ABC transporter ATP-binding protein/permease [Brucepastera parasyntrophica]
MIRTLAKSIREHKKTTLLTVVLSVCEAFFDIIIPLCMSNLIDFGIEDGSMAAVFRYGTALVIFAAFQLLSGMFAARFGAKASAGFSANLREDIYNNVQTFSFSNMDKFSTSSIITRLTTDITNIQNAYQMIIRIAVRAPLLIIFCLVVSFQISREISLVFLVMVPILALGLYLILRYAKPVIDRALRAYDKLNNIVQENLHGVRVVKSFNRQDHEIGKFSRTSEAIYQDYAKAERMIAFNSPLMQFCMYACMILISWFGAKAIVASGNNAALGLTAGGLTALFSYATQILYSLMALSMIFAMVTIAASSAERIGEILNEETDIKNPDHPVTRVENGDISYENVDFVYAAKAGKKVIDSASISIKSGETVGIIGATGSSKTSFVQLIPRLYDVSGGSVRVGGVDVRQYDLDTLRSEVAMVLQKNTLFSGTIKENLRWGNETATDEELEEACRLACADEFISAMPEGYDTHIEQGGTNVSGGQKQRLCIARALLKKPKILILDDSTSAVDTKTDKRIQAAFRQYIPETTKIIIAQRVASVQEADKIIVLDDGKIEAVGTSDELMRTSEIYRQVFESQKKGSTANE